MDQSPTQQLEDIYPLCRSLAGEEAWGVITRRLAEEGGPDLEALLRAGDAPDGLPPYLADLAWLEQARAEAAQADAPGPVRQYEVNPALYLKQVQWLGLEGLTAEQPDQPKPGEAWLLVWREPASGRVMAGPANDQDLLALKMVVEELDPAELAEEMGAKPSDLYRARRAAASRGILLAPATALARVGPPGRGRTRRPIVSSWPATSSPCNGTSPSSAT